jgi:hypothetical protein
LRAALNGGRASGCIRSTLTDGSRKMMNSERLIRILAGSFVLFSLALGAPASPFHHSSYWLWFTVFVGFNLLQSGFTNFCPAEQILWKLGVKKSGTETPSISATTKL